MAPRRDPGRVRMLRGLLRFYGGALDPVERFVLAGYYGFDAPPRSLQSLADEIGRKQAHVRQARLRAEARLDRHAGALSHGDNVFGALAKTGERWEPLPVPSEVNRRLLDSGVVRREDWLIPPPLAAQRDAAREALESAMAL